MRNLEKLKEVLKGYGKITILGHDNIDVDAFLSGILLSNFLRVIGIDNEFVILEEVKEDMTYNIVKEACNIDMKEYQSNEDSSRNLFLVDHYSSIHAGNVVACLDHHPTNDKKAQGYPFYYSRVSCSTSYMVYELMMEAGYKLSREEANMILVSMMVDTVSFRSSKTVKTETIEAKRLAYRFNLDYDEIGRYCLCLTPIDEMTVEDIANNGYKYYNYDGDIVKSSYVQLCGVDENLVSSWLKEISRQIKSEGLVLWVFIVYDFEKEITIEYHVTHGLEVHFEHKGILSRGKDIMPKVEKIFIK